MQELISTALWAAVAVYGIQRWADVVERFAPIAADPLSAPVLVKDIPEDLMALAMTEREAWAQEEVVRVIQERFETLQDWNKVRASMGIGIRDEG